LVHGDAADTSKNRRKKRRKKKKKKNASSAQSMATKDYSSDEDIENFVHAIVIKNRNSNSNSNSNNKSSNNKNKNKNKEKNPHRNAPSGASNLSTPQEILRSRLIEGDAYEASLVDQAMEEMWEKGMPYDEYDSVVNYLNGGVCGTTASTASNSIISVSTKTEDCNEEVEIMETQNGAFGLVMSEMGQDTTVVATANSDVDDTQEENDNDGEKSVESAPKPAPSVSMMTKLDLVAGFENLTDAIFALTQWVKQAANEEEVELFCRAEKTSALPTVVRRGILFKTDDNKRFESAVQPAIVGLLMAVLNRCGVDSFSGDAKAEIVERMGATLKHARKVSLLAKDQTIIDDEKVISDRVSRFIVSRLTRAMDEMNEYKKNNNDYPGEISRSINVGNDNDVAMAALMSERDVIIADAKRSFASAKRSMDSLFVDTATNMSSNTVINGHASLLQPTSSLEIQNIILHIVDEETKKRLDGEKSRLEVLKSQARPEGEISDTVKRLRESLLSLKTKRQAYQEKIAELKAALHELESQDEEAAFRIESISTQLGEEEQSDDLKTKQLEQDLAVVNESVRYGNLVSGLAGMMKTYGKSIEKATAWKMGKKITDDSLLKYNEKESAEIVTETSTLCAMVEYLSKIRSYFLKEADCATKLRQRLLTKKVEVSVLQSELSQYNGVKGIVPTIIAQTQKSIAEKEQIIRADNHRITALTDDGRFMYNELLTRLKTYHSKTTENTKTDGAKKSNSVMLAELFPTELLRDVPVAIQALGIVQTCDELAPFVKERAVEKSTNNSEKEPTLERLQLSIENSVAVRQSPAVVAAVAPPVPPTTAPKLSWATSRAKFEVASQEKHSLLEIQKEEMIRSFQGK